jgi:5'-phosphate synthase pdxT subunit
MGKRVGVLALQGAFSLHKPHIEALGGIYKEVRQAKDLETLDALILPGGESTVMLKHLKNSFLFEPLRAFASEKKTWGICAGAILLAYSVKSPEQESLGLVPIEITRNYYGAQLQSFEEELEGERVSYIRAPHIKILSEEVRVEYKRGEEPVSVLYKNLRATAFHPELNLKYPSAFYLPFYEIA